jgi:hypothetical protein
MNINVLVRFYQDILPVLVLLHQQIVQHHTYQQLQYVQVLYVHIRSVQYEKFTTLQLLNVMTCLSTAVSLIRMRVMLI